MMGRVGHFNHLGQQTISSRAKCVFAVGAATDAARPAVSITGSGCCLFPSHRVPPLRRWYSAHFTLSP